MNVFFLLESILPFLAEAYLPLIFLHTNSKVKLFSVPTPLNFFSLPNLQHLPFFLMLCQIFSFLIMLSSETLPL